MKFTKLGHHYNYYQRAYYYYQHHKWYVLRVRQVILISLMKRPLKTIPEPLTAPLTKREQGPCQYSLLQCPEATQRSFHLVTTDHKGQHLIGQDLTLPTVETVLVLIETLSCLLLLLHLSPRNLQYVSQFLYYLTF